MDYCYCAACGAVGEPTIRSWVEDYGEPLSEALCPECGSDDLEEAVRCDFCGEYHSADDTRWGVCVDCLDEALDYDVFYRFAIEPITNAADTMTDFMLSRVFKLDKDDIPKRGSDELTLLLSREYQKRAINDKELKKEDFLAEIKDYLFKTGSLATDFAEWLVNEKEKEAGDVH